MSVNFPRNVPHLSTEHTQENFLSNPISQTDRREKKRSLLRCETTFFTGSREAFSESKSISADNKIVCVATLAGQAKAHYQLNQTRDPSRLIARGSDPLFFVRVTASLKSVPTGPAASPPPPKSPFLYTPNSRRPV